jgi:HD-GYP domain-containing protein (c-di-GMP phosphodiesterase class II)
MESAPQAATRAGSRRSWGLGKAESLRLLPILLPVTLAGAASVIAAMWGYSMSPPSPGDAAGIVVLLAAAIFAEAYPVPVERLPAGSVSLAAVFILGSGILFGWEAAVIVGLITRVALELAEDRPLVKLIYNGAVYALAGLAAGLTTNLFAHDQPVGGRILQVVLGALAFYLVNIPLIAGIVSRWARQPFRTVLATSMLGTAVSFAIMASVSLALVALWAQSPAFAVALAGPLIAVVLPGHGEEAARRVGDKLVRDLAGAEMEHGGTVSFSAGVATFPQHGVDRAELVRVADIALYWAKGEGKNRVRVYRADMPAMTQLQRLATDPDRTARLQAAAALAGAVDARDAYVGSHSHRVGEYAAAVAERLDLPREEVELIRLAGKLHDLGKLAIPEEILRKRGALTPREREVLERHPQIGQNMLDPLGIEPVASWVLHHHERWDGDGYPGNLAGERIPIGARIIFAADSFDAMTSERVYRKALSFDEATDELRRCSGTQFDPVVVDALLDELETYGRRLSLVPDEPVRLPQAS